MIVKSYEIKKKISTFLKYNFFLLYGENFGLKKDIKELIKMALKQIDNNIEILSGFILEVIFTFFLMLVIISVATDTIAVGKIAGIAIGTMVAVAALAGGELTGASMNPARSLGPAIISGNLEQIWLYILAPVIGAICGALVYENIRLK